MTRIGSERARRLVAGWQEKAYGELSEAMGLGWQPRAGFDALFQPAPSDASRAITIGKETFGEESLSHIDLDEMQLSIEEKFSAYYPDVTTPWEDPIFIVPARYYLDEALSSPVWYGDYVIELNTFVASLPSLGMTTLTRAFPSTEEAVVLVQHGVLLFLHQISCAVAILLPWEWYPPAPLVQPSSSLAMPGSAMNSMRSHEHLSEALQAYVVNGTSRSAGDLKLFSATQHWRMQLFESAIRFLMSHELSHLALKHLPRSSLATRGNPWEQESAADLLGGIAAVARETTKGVSEQIATMGCILALLATHAVELGVHYLRSGNYDLPRRPSHPPGVVRADQLLSAMALRYETVNQLPADSNSEFRRRLQAAINIAMHQIRECLASIASLRESGIRPSAVWSLAPPLPHS